MSTTPRPPLLSDDEIERYSMMYTIPSRYETARALKHAKGIYEAARAKDAELIQRLVDGLEHAQTLRDNRLYSIDSDLKYAAAAGFKPTEP